MSQSYDTSGQSDLPRDMTTHTTTTNADNTVIHHHHHHYHYYTAPGQGPSSGPNFAHDSQANHMHGSIHDMPGTNSGLSSYNTTNSHHNSSVPSHQMSSMNLGGNNESRQYDSSGYPTNRNAIVGEKSNSTNDTSRTNTSMNDRNNGLGSGNGNMPSNVGSRESNQNTGYNSNDSHHHNIGSGVSDHRNPGFESHAHSHPHDSNSGALSHGTSTHSNDIDQSGQKVSFLDKMNPMKDTSGMSIGSTSKNSNRDPDDNSHNTRLGSKTNTDASGLDSNSHNTNLGTGAQNVGDRSNVQDMGPGSNNLNTGPNRDHHHASDHPATAGEGIGRMRNASNTNTSDRTSTSMHSGDLNTGHTSNIGHSGLAPHHDNRSDEISGSHEHSRASTFAPDTNTSGFDQHNVKTHNNTNYSHDTNQIGHKATLGEKLNPMKDTSGMQIGSNTNDHHDSMLTGGIHPNQHNTGTGVHASAHHTGIGSHPNSSTTDNGVHSSNYDSSNTYDQGRNTNSNHYTSGSDMLSRNSNGNRDIQTENQLTGAGISNSEQYNRNPRTGINDYDNSPGRHGEDHQSNVANIGSTSGIHDIGTGHHHRNEHHADHHSGDNTSQHTRNHTTSWDDSTSSRMSDTTASGPGSFNSARNTSGMNAPVNTSHESSVAHGQYPGHITTESRDAMSGVNTHSKSNDLHSSSSLADRHRNSTATHGGSQLSPSGTGVGASSSNDQTTHNPDAPRGHATIGEKLNPFKDTSGMKMTTSAAKAHERDATVDQNTASNRTPSGTNRKPVASHNTTGSPLTQTGLEHSTLPTRTSGFEHAGPGYDRTAKIGNTSNVNSNHGNVGSESVTGHTAFAANQGAHGSNNSTFGHNTNTPGQGGHFDNHHTSIGNAHHTSDLDSPHRQHGVVSNANPGMSSHSAINSNTGVGSHTGSAPSNTGLTSSSTNQGSRTGFESNSNHGYDSHNNVGSSMKPVGTHNHSESSNLFGTDNGHGGSRYYQPTQHDRQLNGDGGVGTHPTLGEKMNPLKNTSSTTRNSSEIGHNTSGPTMGSGVNTGYNENTSTSTSQNSHHHGHDSRSSVSDTTSQPGSSTNRHSSGSEKPSMGQRMKAALTGSSGHKTTGGSSTTTPGSGGMQATQTVRDETGTYEVRRVA